MPDYQEGKIYKIYDRDDESQFYIGSTALPLNQRLWSHKGCKNKKKFEGRLVYNYFNKVGWDRALIELIERYPCEKKLQLNKREGEKQKELNPPLNHVISGRTKKEYYEDNKDNISEYHKEWREDNKDILKKKRAQYYKGNKETINKQNKANYFKDHEKNKEWHRQYHEQNKEKRNKQNNERYHNNKEKILEKQKIKTTCESCGTVYRKCAKARHEKSIKHLKSINKEEPRNTKIN